MTTTAKKRLPKGWYRGHSNSRANQLRKLPERVCVLLAAGWAWSVLPVFEREFPDDNRPRRAIELEESRAIDAAVIGADAIRGAIRDASNAAYNAAVEIYRSGIAAALAADAAYAAIAGPPAEVAYFAAEAGAEWSWLYATYRHARGPRKRFRPEWRTSDAVALARGIFHDRAFDRMPYLADALQDAGCNDTALTRHLQEDHTEFTRADWVLTQLVLPDAWEK